jgi:hypothetical protein
MPRPILAAVAVAAALLLAVLAAGAPRDVVRDYFVDDQTHGAYSMQDLRGPLAFVDQRTAPGRSTRSLPTPRARRLPTT